MDVEDRDSIDTVKLKKELTNAIGEAKGYIHNAYREFCIQQPDLIVAVQEGHIQGNRTILKEMSGRLETIFEDYMRSISSGSISQKDAKKSVQFRDQGNKNYQAKHFYSALDCYTKAICQGPIGSETLALALANRSAVMFHLKEFQHCIQDLDLAIASDYPKKTLFKLYERKIKCLTQLGNLNLAQTTLNQFSKALDFAVLEPSKKQKMFSELEKTISKIKAKPQEDSTFKSLADELPKLNSRNDKFPSFAKCLSVEYNAKRGRHVVANRDIKAGEMVMVELPTVVVVRDEFKSLFCSNCLRKSYGSIPSPLNSVEVFCSHFCLEQGLNSFHRCESKILEHIQHSGLGKAEWRLAIRAVTQKPLEYFRKNQDKFQNHSSRFGMNEGDQYGADEYQALFHLVVNRQAWNLSTDLFKAFVACFYTRCLHLGGYFDDEENDDNGVNGGWTGTLSDDQLFITEFMVHIMEASTMNSHEISHVTAPTNVPWFHGQPRRVGPVLNIYGSLLNHSCDPNIFWINRGKAIISFASKDIKMDDEVTNCYITESLKIPMEQRQIQLKNFYNFTCGCVACDERWPPMAQFPTALADLKAKQLKIPVEDVNRMKAQLAKINQLGVKINLEQKKENYKDCLALCIEFLQLLDHTIKRPHQFFEMTTRTMFMSLWTLRGSKSRIDQT
ncbi:hypothetical protein TCAL_07774 [Tigriopus californicus]|uniref:SET domain-containing protein n=1 Tax=Tigriopus californicus TaxID=6832 RepID=A0A553P7Q9_TIGCA|nr:SET and MYND domain-containing protein 4-like [Tigriopus californicus]TRY73713.1 hypothetical protein TCAL_07774 [Tigriopus californicus]|eukprot:TCALIF_07774-PA protein Name:"Similar to SMYD4 SET and MYND domain-containing protein 4 (Pongo abelii)" AED:0.02 eAED:0.02 QI:85/1/1/1/1/1/4/268/672